MVIPDITNTKWSLILINEDKKVCSISCIDHGEWSVSLKKPCCPVCTKNLRAQGVTKDPGCPLDDRLSEIEGVKNKKITILATFRVNKTKKSTLKCPIHGVFTFSSYWLASHSGCPYCKKKEKWVEKNNFGYIDESLILQAVDNPLEAKGLAKKYGLKLRQIKLYIRLLQKRG